MPRTERLDLERLGRYEIRSRLGSGGMAVVYLAHDPFLDGPVAVKILRDDDPDLRARFTREARAIARLRGHPNIVTVYDVGEDDGRPFMAMEYLGDETLAKVLRQSPSWPLPRRLELIAGLCAGLARAHSEGIVHRDIKPDNLMVNGGMLKILDFGIARLANSGMTQDGMLMGSMPYMSPEQISGGTIDARSDIFAVGAVLYEAVALKRAFTGGIEVLHKILEVGAPPIRGVVPDISPELEHIVDRALNRDPQQRFQTALEMQRALTIVVDSLDGADRTIILKRGAQPGDARVSTERRAQLRRQQVTEHLTAGRHALETGDYDAALQHGELAATVDPDSGPAIELIDAARNAIEAARISALLIEGDRLLVESRLDEAQVAARDALKASTQHPDIALKVRAEHLAASIAQAQKRQAEVQRLWQRALDALARREHEQAWQAAMLVLELDPSRDDARDLGSRAYARLEEEREQARIREAALDEIKAATGLTDAGRFDDALHALQHISPPSDTVRRAVADALAEIERRRRQVADGATLDAAARALNSGDFEGGLALLNTLHQPDAAPAMELRSALESAQTRARERRARIDAIWREAQAAFTGGDHARARVAAQSVLNLEPDRADARALFENAERLLNEAAARVEAEQRARALIGDAMALVTRGDLDQASVLLETIVAPSPLLRRAVADVRHEVAERRQRDADTATLAAATAALERGDVNEARAALGRLHAADTAEARRVLQDIDAFERRVAEEARLAAERRALDEIEAAKTLAERGDYDSADANLATVILSSDAVRRAVGALQADIVGRRRQEADDLARQTREREAAEARERAAAEAREREAAEASEREARAAREREAAEARERQAAEARQREADAARERELVAAREREREAAGLKREREAAEAREREAAAAAARTREQEAAAAREREREAIDAR
ncbi:MAG: protein kinase, partial [Vicinamibacterales bacterium]